jgi:L-2,4-diaminobutyric acid acetyltransferase
MSETTHISKNDVLTDITFRQPNPTDGLAVWQAVQQAGTLEVNSAYFYLIFCTDFADTCLVAEYNGEVIGVVVGYHPPADPQTAFCWQIGMVPHWQGRGLGKRLLSAWLALPGNRDVNWVTATVAEDNAASDSLFRGLARDLGVACEVTPHFTESLLQPGHRPEPLYRIGPIHSAR